MLKHLLVLWTICNIHIWKIIGKGIMKAFIGIEESDNNIYEKFKIFSRGLLVMDINLPGTTFYKAMKVGNELRKEMKMITEERREKLVEINSNLANVYYNDVLTQLIIEQDEDGNYETTATTITLTMKYLKQKPEFFNEIMEGVFREAIEDFTYEDFHVTKGWKIYLSFGATQKNGEYFPNPTKFDPSRFEGNEVVPYTSVSFGGGHRMCPGKEFARILILVFLHHVLKKI
ncbi:hypothetical protein H5410_057888 [Solanum commersonii]|uniref:Cytochrome P450 n=1 Tax=Solanum commersonii TaxID=4109 RepID=A0A9J5WQ76_SOLCO|nr:hypothetical protein H5410_057888 [Solanum commersonii]